MTMLRELAAEAVGMFVGEQRLTLAVLMVVAAAGYLAGYTNLDPIIAGAVLLVGCLALLVESVCRCARTAAPGGSD